MTEKVSHSTQQGGQPEQGSGGFDPAHLEALQRQYLDGPSDPFTEIGYSKGPVAKRAGSAAVSAANVERPVATRRVSGAKKWVDAVHEMPPANDAIDPAGLQDPQVLEQPLPMYIPPSPVEKARVLAGIKGLAEQLRAKNNG